MKFDRLGDVKLYLVGSVVMYKSRPVKVMKVNEGIGGKFYLDLRHLTPHAKVFTTTTDDPLISLDPPHLGYINVQGKAVYLQRDPVRHYKRGLESNNVRSRHFRYEAISYIEKEDYPTFSTVLSLIEH